MDSKPPLDSVRPLMERFAAKIGAPGFGSLTMLAAGISLVAGLLTIHQSITDQSAAAAQFFFFASVVFAGSFCFPELTRLCLTARKWNVRSGSVKRPDSRRFRRG